MNLKGEMSVVPKNRFEQVDTPVADAITLVLLPSDGEPRGRIECPAALAGGHLVNDFTSDELPARDAFRGAIRLANEIKAPVVVVDEAGLWQQEWGELYREQ